MKKMTIIFKFILILCTVYVAFVQVENVNAETLRTKIVVAQNSKKANKKIAVINTRQQLINSIIKKVTSLDKNIRFKIARRVVKNNDKEFGEIFNKLSESMEYNEIMSYTNGYTVSRSDDGGKYYYFSFKPNYTINRDEAKTILENIPPIIKTREELIKSIVAHTENLDEEFSINIDNSVLSYDNKNEFNEFWDRLYEIPELNDIVHYSKDEDSDFIPYKNYYKWKTKIKYDITKKEVDDLNNFVKSWVAENIQPTMSEEEKVRSINDFMVKEYRYTYGEKPKDTPDTSSCPAGKLGKYLVHTSFSLLYGKGGVCDSKAKMFYRLAKEVGLDVIYITGKVDDGLHAWNMVKIDGNWYHNDVTWNRGHYEESGEYDYFESREYYLKGDSSMSRDHSWDRAKYPAANTDYPLGPEQAVPEDTDNIYYSFSLRNAS